MGDSLAAEEIANTGRAPGGGDDGPGRAQKSANEEADNGCLAGGGGGGGDYRLAGQSNAAAAITPSERVRRPALRRPSRALVVALVSTAARTTMTCSTTSSCA